MKVSLSWLKAYVDIQMDLDRLVDALTMAGLEVDSVVDRYGYMDAIVVGRVKTVEPHPHADRLRICTVDLGGRTAGIVCGAPNVRPELNVPVALPGTEFPGGHVIGKSVIRGVDSEGMICSESELALGEDHSGIMELSSELAAGEALAKALRLSDPVIDIDLTPNRPDCLSIIGVAREIAAIQNTPLRYPDTDLSASGKDIHRLTSVRIQAPDLCPRYAARLLADISVGPSPFWLKDKLLSVGLRPINNIVDITNFVMLETGQPLHAFDFDRLAGHKIIVRCAAEGEVFSTLDQKERQLSSDMLMICDGEKPVAIGGVMGGLNSEIEAATTRVLIESACFNPVSIRKTAKTLGLGTDASHRFERGVDPHGTVKALNRATRLMAEVSGGRMVAGLIDEHPQPAPQQQIRLSIARTNRLLGTAFGMGQVGRMLESIEFKTSPAGSDNLMVHPPSYRVDVLRPEDLMEEVARLSGYNTIPTTFPAMPSEARREHEPRRLRNRIKSLMCGFGFSEAINYSFVHRDSARQLLLPESDRRHATVSIVNPLSDDQSVMRTSLVPGLLLSMQRNLARGEKDLRLFEIGKIYLSRGEDRLPDEIEMIAGLWTGRRAPHSWTVPDEPCDFYDIKGTLEALLARLAITDTRFSALADDQCHYVRAGLTAQVLIGAERIGLVGELNPRVLNVFDLQQTGYIFELNLDRLAPLLPGTTAFKPVPVYPAVPRDITLILDKSVESGSVLEAVAQCEEPLVETVFLFDVFEGDPIPSGKKSISIRIVYRSPHRTLEDSEINRLHKDLTAKLVNQFKALLPE